MLEEIKNVAQDERSLGHRKWFQDENIELIVWFSADKQLSGLELIYDLGKGERSLTWKKGSLLGHFKVMTDDKAPLKNLSPTLIPNGEIPKSELIKTFIESSKTIDDDIRETVLNYLNDI